MALVEDLFKGTTVTGVAVGLGAVLLAPTVIPAVGRVVRPALKAAIKGGMVFYRETVAEIGEVASDLFAEARAELEHNGHDKSPAPTGHGGGKSGH